MDESGIFGLEWQDVIASLCRHWKLTTVCFVAGMTLVAAIAFFERPTYEATATLMVTSERARITVSPDPNSGPTVERVTDQELNSEATLLQSPMLIREVLESYRDRFQPHPSTGLKQTVGAILRYPFELPGRLYGRAHGVASLSPFERWVQEVMARVKVNAVRGSSLIEVSFADSNPQWAAKFVNELAAHHVERHARLSQQSEALGFLEEQRSLLNHKMQQAEAALKAFYNREGIDTATEQRPALRSRLAELELSLSSSYTELKEASARADFLSHVRADGGAVGLEGRAGPNDPLQLIRSRIVELQLQRSELLAKFAPTSTRIQAVDKQIEEAQRLMKEQEVKHTVSPAVALELSKAREQVAAVNARIESLQQQIDDCRTTLDHLERVAPEQERLEQDLATAKASFLTYSKKVEEARFSNALDQSRIVNVSIADRAEVPVAPNPSKRLLTLLLGAVMSLMAGVGLSLLLDRLDPTVQSAAAAHKASGLPVLSDIPS